MTQAQEVATLQQENAAVKRQVATLTRQLAEANKLLAVAMQDIDLSAFQWDTEVATLTRELAEARTEARQNICAAIVERSRAEAAERQIAAVRAYCLEAQEEYKRKDRQFPHGMPPAREALAAARACKHVLTLLDAPFVPSPQLPTGGVHAEAVRAIAKRVADWCDDVTHEEAIDLLCDINEEFRELALLDAPAGPCGEDQ